MYQSPPSFISWDSYRGDGDTISLVAQQLAIDDQWWLTCICNGWSLRKVNINPNQLILPSYFPYSFEAPDTGFEVRALAVWGRARYLSVTAAPHNIESLRVSGKKTFCFLETWRPEWVRTRDLRLSEQAALTTAPRMTQLTLNKHSWNL